MIQENSVVTMHYSVSTADGVEIDSSRDGKPLVFMHGQGYLVQGLEEAVVGKSAGDTFKTEIEAQKAYGERYDNLIQAVPKSMFDGMEVTVGMSFRATTDDGEQSVIVIDVTEDEIVVDGNHPLAGVDLTFDVEILEVRSASEKEIAEGRVCETGCCH